MKINGLKLKISKKFKKNILLKNYTTFKIGGPAKFFLEVKKRSDLIKAIKLAKNFKLPFFILGGGSNLLVSDKGFNGLVIKLELKNYEFRDSSLYAESGVSFSRLVKESGERGLAGLEWASGLPGTFGGAVFGNAGAFGGEIKNKIIFVEALDRNLNFKKLKNKECHFSYRSSIFKKRGWIILAAKIRLQRGNRKNIQKIILDNIKYRQERHPLEYPNAGSIFKNCALRKVPIKYQKIFKDVVKKDPFKVIPAAAIIAKTPGLVGKRKGGAQISSKHPNFIVNLGGAKATDVIKLINLIKKRVKKRFGIELEEEIRRLGF